MRHICWKPLRKSRRKARDVKKSTATCAQRRLTRPIVVSRRGGARIGMVLPFQMHVGDGVATEEPRFAIFASFREAGACRRHRCRRQVGGIQADGRPSGQVADVRRHHFAQIGLPRLAVGRRFCWKLRFVRKLRLAGSCVAHTRWLNAQVFARPILQHLHPRGLR